MVTCARCGAEANENDKFCPHCGTSLAPKMSETLMKEKRVPPERDVCFGERKRDRDYLGLVSFGIFLLIVGIVFAANPDLVSDFRLWIERITSNRVLVRPPEGLITSATIFFGLIGLSKFLMAGIRLVVDKVRRRALGDMFSGVALVLFAYLINLYRERALVWQMVLAIEAIVCGLLVISYSLVRYVSWKD